MIKLTDENKKSLIDAIASGASEVEYSDKKIRYRSLKEMVETLNLFGVNDGAKKSNVRATAFIRDY